MADFGAPSDNENAIRSRRKKISVFPVPMSTISPISKVQLKKKILLARPNGQDQDDQRKNSYFKEMFRITPSGG